MFGSEIFGRKIEVPAAPTSNRKKPEVRWTSKYVELEARLDQVLADTRRFGLSDDAALDAIFAWAARRAYDAAGYSMAKVLMLNALEDILLHDAYHKAR